MGIGTEMTSIILTSPITIFYFSQVTFEGIQKWVRYRSKASPNARI